MADRVKGKDSLWVLTASPVIWAAHFLLCYITAAVWCAKVAGEAGTLHTVRLAIAVYTLLALAGITAIGWSGYQKHRMSRHLAATDQDTPESRRRFLGWATLLLSGLSAVAVLYAALVAVFVERCY